MFPREDKLKSLAVGDLHHRVLFNSFTLVLPFLSKDPNAEDTEEIVLNLFLRAFLREIADEYGCEI